MGGGGLAVWIAVAWLVGASPAGPVESTGPRRTERRRPHRSASRPKRIGPQPRARAAARASLERERPSPSPGVRLPPGVVPLPASGGTQRRGASALRGSPPGSNDERSPLGDSAPAPRGPTSPPWTGPAEVAPGSRPQGARPTAPVEGRPDGLGGAGRGPRSAASPTLEPERRRRDTSDDPGAPAHRPEPSRRRE